MKLVMVLILGLSTLGLSAQTEPELNPSTDLIAENYEAGIHLIYDCDEKHWACVRSDYAEACEATRAERRKEVTERVAPMDLPCARIGSFPTKESCFQRQLFMTSQNHGSRFCINDPWRQREMRD